MNTETQNCAEALESTAITASLAAIWADILRVSHIEADDDFFDLGGDSLAAIRMLDAIGREFGEERIEPDLIYTASCFKDFAAAVSFALHQGQQVTT